MAKFIEVEPIGHAVKKSRMLINVEKIAYVRERDGDVTECLSIAYEEIKNRKGKMVNGTFVKEDDL